MDEWFISALRMTTRLIEIGGIAIIVIGLLSGTIAFLREIRLVDHGSQAYSDYRSRVGRAILLGLEFLVAADIVVGKSGGLTVAEVLACGRPLLVTRTLQGQESFNVRFLERHGIGRLVGNDQLAQQVREWLESQQVLQDIQARAAAAGRRDGALRVAEQALELAARRLARVARRSAP